MNIKIFSLVLLISSVSGCRSNNTDGPQPGSILPDLNMLLSDSMTTFRTSSLQDGRPIVVMFFSPSCSHCQEETKMLMAHNDKLQKIHFVFLTLSPIGELADFYKRFHFQSYPNFVVGKDNDFTFYHYYKPKNVPYMAIYDSEKKLTSIVIGNESIEDLINLTQNATKS